MRAGVPAALASWPGDHHCVFCNLASSVEFATGNGMGIEEAEAAAGLIWRGENNFICLNAFPYTSGHMMVVPYAHIDALNTLPRAAAEEMMALTQRAEAALRALYKPQGINIGMNLGQAAGAGVAGHIHMHVLPRWAGDTNFMTTVAETRVLPEELAATWKRLRAELAK